MASKVITCKYYVRGQCAYGDRCHYAHPPGKENSLPKTPLSRRQQQQLRQGQKSALIVDFDQFGFKACSKSVQQDVQSLKNHQKNDAGKYRRHSAVSALVNKSVSAAKIITSDGAANKEDRRTVQNEANLSVTIASNEIAKNDNFKKQQNTNNMNCFGYVEQYTGTNQKSPSEDYYFYGNNNNNNSKKNRHQNSGGKSANSKYKWLSPALSRDMQNSAITSKMANDLGINTGRVGLKTTEITTVDQSRKTNFIENFGKITADKSENLSTQVKSPPKKSDMKLYEAKKFSNRLVSVSGYSSNFDNDDDQSFDESRGEEKWCQRQNSGDDYAGRMQTGYLASGKQLQDSSNDNRKSKKIADISIVTEKDLDKKYSMDMTNVGFKPPSSEQLMATLLNALYSSFDDLTKEEQASFEARQFEMGKVPEKPPPSSLC